MLTSSTPHHLKTLELKAYELLGAEETTDLGARLGRLYLEDLHSNPNPPHSNISVDSTSIDSIPSLIAAEGELGTGKTTFAQGLAHGLAVPEDHYVNSPTFALLQTHPGLTPFHHIDLYRLEDEEELEFLGFDDLIEDGVAYIEWPQRGPQLFYRPHLKISFSYPADGVESRMIQIKISASDETQCEVIAHRLRSLFT